MIPDVRTGEPVVCTTAGAAVRVEHLTVTHPDGTMAVEDLSLRVDPGEMVAVVGPSGCGKSTLLRVLAGLQAVTSGHVDTGDARLGMAFQEPALLAWRTVRANVELPGEIVGVPARARRSRAEVALARVGLADLADRYPRSLSGGQRSRVALARALLLTPDLLLLDEPFAALDELARERLNADLLRLQRTQCVTTLVVTHSVAEAVYLGHRVAVLSPAPGHVVAEVAVPFGADRPAALRYDAAFGAVAGEVAAALRESAR